MQWVTKRPDIILLFWCSNPKWVIVLCCSEHFCIKMIVLSMIHPVFIFIKFYFSVSRHPQGHYGDPRINSDVNIENIRKVSAVFWVLECNDSVDIITKT